MIATPFSNYVPTIKLRPCAHAQRILKAPKSKRAELLLADAANSIHITSQAESDESRKKAGRRIGV